jgi:hypothetical protein
MSLLYKGQSLITITVETGFENLASAEVKKILYQKPDGTKGYWVATASGTKLVYEVSANDIDSVGTWQLQAYIEVSGKKGFGQITTQNFSQPLN